MRISRSLLMLMFLSLSGCMAVPLEDLALDLSPAPSPESSPPSDSPSVSETPEQQTPDASTTPAVSTPTLGTPDSDTPTVTPDPRVTNTPPVEPTATPPVQPTATPSDPLQQDADGDGFSPAQGDCVDSDPQISPEATEIPYDGIDQDCQNGDLIDVDGDGSTASQVGGADCNDADAQIAPGIAELPYDGIDQDCDNLDETDVDLDGEDALEVGGLDCDDQDPDINSTSPEQCDGIDNNCNGATDESLTTLYFQDADGDGYGDNNQSLSTCETPPAGYITQAGDCQDGNPAISPAGTEQCNGVDDNCNGTIDELPTQTYYQDADGDGYGNASASQVSCAQPAGYVSNNTDCNDSNPNVSPVGVESSNGVDDNCDGMVDFYASCEAMLAARPSTTSGVYEIDPDGTGAATPFKVYCEMSLRGGGWTVLAIITNADGENWRPDSENWVSTSIFGSPTTPSTNADAKSRAYNELLIQELLLIKWPSNVELLTSESCIPSNTLRNMFRVNSSSSSNCARSCTLKERTGVWASDDWQDNTLRLRCRDGDWSYSVGGYSLSISDNSFMTTMVNSSDHRDYVFGFGTSEGWYDAYGDFGSEIADYPITDRDTTQRLILGR